VHAIEVRRYGGKLIVLTEQPPPLTRSDNVNRRPAITCLTQKVSASGGKKVAIQ